MTTYFNQLETIVNEAAEYMTYFEKGFIEIEICHDLNEETDEVNFVIDIAVNPHLPKLNVYRGRTFEFGYTMDAELAVEKAHEANEAMKKAAAGTNFELKGISEIDY